MSSTPLARDALYLALAACGIAVPASAAPFTAIYSFGDSLSDVGNVFLATGGSQPAAPYYNGRFSNGPNWIDDLSASLGVGPAVPSLAGGHDYAYGGAVTGSSVPGASTAVPNITQQVQQFTGTVGAAPSSALYTVWIGANDAFTALRDLGAGTLTPAQAQADLAAAAQTEANAITLLAKDGAQTFIVPFVPDLGKTPAAASAPAAATQLAQFYNGALVSDLQGLVSGGVTVNYVNTFAFIDQAVANPSAFGFTDVADPCYVGALTGGGTVCASPNTYLFWDQEHPTATGYALVAQDALATAVPEPPSATLLGAAVMALLGLGWRRSRG